VAPHRAAEQMARDRISAARVATATR